MVVNSPAAEIEGDRSNERDRVVRLSDHGDPARGGLKVILHNHSNSLSPGFFRECRGIISTSDKLRADMHVHVDNSFVIHSREWSVFRHPLLHLINSKSPIACTRTRQKLDRTLFIFCS